MPYNIEVVLSSYTCFVAINIQRQGCETFFTDTTQNVASDRWSRDLCIAYHWSPIQAFLCHLKL